MAQPAPVVIGNPKGSSAVVTGPPPAPPHPQAKGKKHPQHKKIHAKAHRSVKHQLKHRAAPKHTQKHR